MRSQRQVVALARIPNTGRTLLSGNLRAISWDFGIESREKLFSSVVQMVRNFCEGRGLTVSLESSDRVMSVCAAWRYPLSQTGQVMLCFDFNIGKEPDVNVVWTCTLSDMFNWGVARQRQAHESSHRRLYASRNSSFAQIGLSFFIRGCCVCRFR